MATVGEIEKAAFDRVVDILEDLWDEVNTAADTLSGLQEEANAVVELKMIFIDLAVSMFGYEPTHRGNSLAETMRNFAEIQDEFNDFCDTMLDGLRG